MENKTELMQLRHPDYDRELTELVRSNLSPKAFREKLLDYHENDIAAALETLTPAERQRIYHALDAAELSAVPEMLPSATADSGNGAGTAVLALPAPFSASESAVVSREPSTKNARQSAPTHSGEAVFLVPDDCSSAKE